MSVQTAMTAIKTANGTLNSLIGTRFNPDVLPQGVALPACTFQVISRTNSNAMGPGVVNWHPRVQIDGYALTSAKRTELRNAIVGAFYGYSGTIGGELIKSILIVNEMEMVEQLDDNTQAYRILIDFMVDLA